MASVQGSMFQGTDKDGFRGIVPSSEDNEDYFREFYEYPDTDEESGRIPDHYFDNEYNDDLSIYSESSDSEEDIYYLFEDSDMPHCLKNKRVSNIQKRKDPINDNIVDTFTGLIYSDKSYIGMLHENIGLKIRWLIKVNLDKKIDNYF